MQNLGEKANSQKGKVSEKEHQDMAKPREMEAKDLCS